ncbi:capsule biosynthesis protein [Kordiimonas aestuarii]|uniref:capsule biosynthesis protein n=1 Tax=Kordiimonas aestuarii TaxID=1005925 RepID=UPI0021CFDFC2|nr:capsular biosynthesis protein [Kordiimonas aestuarii]
MHAETSLGSTATMARLNVLFLQGLATPFFARLGEKLAADGHTVHRLNFCGADWIFRHDRLNNIIQHRFCGKMQTLPAFYRDFFSRKRIDVIILFGDCRPVHRVACEAAQEAGTTVYVFDEGYIRPGFVTLELGGSNGYSSMPRRIAPIEGLFTRRPARHGPDLPPVATNMGRRARMDIAGHAANLMYKVRFPDYRGHRPATLDAEAKGWFLRILRTARHRRADRATATRFEQTDKPFFLVPLQLNSDYQIRVHSHYGGVVPFIHEVLSSFAAHAPAEHNLFFKNHPLDNGMIDYRSLIADMARELKLESRVFFASGGDLEAMVRSARGVVLINSTVGYATLRLGTPMKVMGTALYDLEGLTDQRSLDTFWQNPTPPQQRLADEFLTVVRTYTQIRGDFFSDAGIALAVGEAVKVINGEIPRLPAA